MRCWWGPLCSRPRRLVFFHSASSLKQQSPGRHVAPLGHIILIPSQPVCILIPYSCVLSGEATNTNFIVFGLTRPGVEPTIYHTRGEHANHYTTDAVYYFYKWLVWNMFRKKTTLPGIALTCLLVYLDI